MDCRAMFAKHALILTLSMGILSGAPAYASPMTEKVAVLQFDAILGLNAPLCRTHVVLFARYWVSPELYRVAIVWAEPHVGSLNFPIYPPTLNVASDREAFRIDHQFNHAYDGVFSKPLGERGAFAHKFNSYYFSDIRFAEQEALDLRIYARDILALKDRAGSDGERVVELLAPRTGDECKQELSRLSIRATEGRIDELRLLDGAGDLLKALQYEYDQQQDGSPLCRQSVLLPQHPIQVGFTGNKPTITIAGEKKEYSELKTTHHEGGRKCVIEHQPVEIGSRRVSAPARITVYRADTMRLLRSARLSNFIHLELSADQLNRSAEQFSLFDSNETKCREMLLKYWVKDPADVNQTDRKTLEELRTHFAQKNAARLTIGEQLRRVNVRLQLDWMLGYGPGLVQNFQEYLSLLTANDLDQMILVGGQHAIETTIRWGQLDAANSLLETWLLAAPSQNSVESALDFAAESFRKGSYWTTLKLLDKVLQMRQLSHGQRFVAQTLRCLGLARLHEMVRNPGHIKAELGIAQAWWVSSQVGSESLQKDLRRSITEAKQSFAGLDHPTRQQKALRAQLEKINLESGAAEVNDPNDIK